MTTAMAQIVTAVIGALQEEPPVSPIIDRAGTTLIPDQANSAVTVQWEHALPADATIAGAPVDWKTTVTVACLARSVREPGDLAVDPLLEAVVQRLAQDTTLGGLVFDLRVVAVQVETNDGGKRTGWVLITYVAEHQTSNGTLN